MSENALKIKNLSKIYPGDLVALNNISLEVKKGDFYALLGPNGAGKSTTIGIISSLVTKTSGLVELMGIDIDVNHSKAKKNLGVVGQEVNFNQFETVSQILEQQAGYFGLPRKIIKERSEYYLRNLGLWDKRKEQGRNLSGGMKRRLMVAKALINNPDLLILDEPTAGVDIELRYMLWDFLKKINNEGKTILLTTHYIEEAEQLCDRIAIIDNGNIITNDKTKNLTSKNGNTQIVIDCDNIDKDNIIKNYNYKINNNQIIVDTENPNKTLPNVVEQLNNSNIIINNIEIKKSTLEQVFLKLTSNYASNK